MMRPSRGRTKLAIVGGLLAGALLLADVAGANGVRFSDFVPLASSAGPTATEATPITFGNPAFQQESVADRNSQLAAGIPNSGAWDMNTINETGADKGKYLFTVFETGQSGVQGHEVATNKTETIWSSPLPGGAVSFDASFWTPWGTFITAEESWCTAPGGCTSMYGRLFELTNPTTAPGITEPLTATSNDGAQMVHRNVIPRVSHEGIQFDRALNMYFIDELNGGSIYRYTSAAGRRPSRRCCG